MADPKSKVQGQESLDKDRYGTGEKYNASDVSYFGELDLSKDYPPGTTFDLGGERVDVNSAPDPFASKGKGKPPTK